MQKPIITLLSQIERFTRKITYFHVPNQLAGVSKTMRLIFAALGVRAGVPDVPIVLSGGRMIWLELKHEKPAPVPRFKKDGTPVKVRERKAKQTSKDQDDFHAILRRLGHPVYVVSAVNGAEASKQVQDILAQHGVIDFRLTHQKDDLTHDWASAYRDLDKSTDSLFTSIPQVGCNPDEWTEIYITDRTIIALFKALEICQRLGLQS